jgi:hypothetical protein
MDDVVRAKGWWQKNHRAMNSHCLTNFSLLCLGIFIIYDGAENAIFLRAAFMNQKQGIRLSV